MVNKDRHLILLSIERIVSPSLTDRVMERFTDNLGRADSKVGNKPWLPVVLLGQTRHNAHGFQTDAHHLADETHDVFGIVGAVGIGADAVFGHGPRRFNE